MIFRGQNSDPIAWVAACPLKAIFWLMSDFEFDTVAGTHRPTLHGERCFMLRYKLKLIDLNIPRKEYTYESMQLAQFKQLLSQHSDNSLGFIHPDGEPIPAEFHVTEVGHVAKKFIDCGGTVRSSEVVMLQTWVSENDKDHRLTAGKLAKIIDLARSLIPSDELEVEVEYEGCVMSQYTVSGFQADGNELKFQLARKHTDCLAKEACGIGSACATTSESKCCI